MGDKVAGELGVARLPKRFRVYINVNDPQAQISLSGEGDTFSEAMKNTIGGFTGLMADLVAESGERKQN